MELVLWRMQETTTTMKEILAMGVLPCGSVC